MARHRLIERREELRLTQRDVARRIGKGTKSYARYERGETTPPRGIRSALADALDWTTPQLVVALQTEQLAAPNGHAVPPHLGHLASLEQGATNICVFEPVAVHGLLQTADYATAVESLGPNRTHPEHVAQKVEARIARQAVLTRDPDPLELSAVLDESVLHRIAGDEDVMATQLDHLADLAVMPNVTLQILPLSAGVFCAAFGSFWLFTSGDVPMPYMVVTEDRTGAHYLDRTPDIDAHTSLFDYLTTVALTPSKSLDLIRTIAEEKYR